MKHQSQKIDSSQIASYDKQDKKLDLQTSFLLSQEPV